MFSLDILGPKTTPLCVWYKYFKWNEIEHFRQFDYHLPEHKAQHIYFHYPGKYSDAMRRQNIPSKKNLAVTGCKYNVLQNEISYRKYFTLNIFFFQFELQNHLFPDLLPNFYLYENKSCLHLIIVIMCLSRHPYR